MMFLKKIFALLCAAEFLFTGVSMAQSQEWESSGFRISIGTSYRNFSAVELSTPDMIGIGGTTSVNNMFEDNQAVRQNLIDGDSSLLPFRTTSYVHGSKHGDSIDADDRIFPVIGFGYDLFQLDNSQISLVSNLQYVDMEIKGSAGGQAYHSLLNKTDGSLFISPSPILNSYNSLTVNADIRGLIWDLGLQLAYPVDNWDFTLAAGPSLNFIKINSSFCSAGSDVEKIVPGVYVSAGMTYWFKPQYGIAFDLRYDKVFDEINTNYVSMDLDSLGGGIKFIYNF